MVKDKNQNQKQTKKIKLCREPLTKKDFTKSPNSRLFSFFLKFFFAFREEFFIN